MFSITEFPREFAPIRMKHPFEPLFNRLVSSAIHKALDKIQSNRGEGRYLTRH